MIRKTMEMANEDFANDEMTPYDINNGCCDEWAELVSKNLEDHANVEIWETVFLFADTSHVFLRINNKFYDAECLDGVDDHMQLPIFEKLFKATNRRQPVWIIETNNEFESKEIRRDITDEEVKEYDKINGTNNYELSGK